MPRPPFKRRLTPMGHHRMVGRGVAGEVPDPVVVRSPVHLAQHGAAGELALSDSALSGRMIAALDALIGDRPCVALTSDLKLRVPRTKLASYADAAVVCGEPVRDGEDPNAVTNPLVIVEVLSDSTERWDRVGRFRHYRALESLRDYVLVSQHDRHIEVYSRDAAGRWVMSEAGEGESVAVSSLGGSIGVDRVYRGIELSPTDASGRPGG